MPIIFATGACGNINPYGTKVGHGNLEGAHRIGRLLGDAVVASGIDVIKKTSVKREEVDGCESSILLPVSPPPPREELERTIAEHLQALKDAESGRADMEHVDLVSHQIQIEWAEEVLRDIEEGKPPPPLEVVLQVLKIGELLTAGISAEVFVEIGMAVKNQWYAEQGAGQHLCAITLANGDIGYIPDRYAFDSGTYEAGGLAYKVYGKYLVTPDSGEKVIARLLEILR